MSRPMIAFHTRKVHLTNDEARTLLEDGPIAFTMLREIALGKRPAKDFAILMETNKKLAAILKRWAP